MLPNHLPQGTNAQTISLLLGHPDPSTLLTPEFEEAVRCASSPENALRSLQYGPDQGNAVLIQFLVNRLNLAQDNPIDARQVMIVAGSTHAVDMIARLYGKPGGIVLVEAPSYVDSLHVMKDHGLELLSVPMDSDGLRTDRLEEVLKRLHGEGEKPEYLYTIPSYHNPTGITLSEERRRTVLALAREYEFWIVEDDVYRDLGFSGTVPPSFFTLAGGENVLSIGSFSKTLAPGLRLGWLVGPSEAIARCVGCGTTQMGGGANPFASSVIAEYCTHSDWQTHIARLQALYRTRCEAALASLEKFMPSGVDWTSPAGGFFIWLTLPPPLTGQMVKRAALDRKVLVAAGEGFYVDPVEEPNHVRLAFSFAPLDDLVTGISILADVIKDLLSVRHP